jgi:hypothetical protein
MMSDEKFTFEIDYVGTSSRYVLLGGKLIEGRVRPGDRISMLLKDGTHIMGFIHVVEHYYKAVDELQACHTHDEKVWLALSYMGYTRVDPYAWTRLQSDAILVPSMAVQADSPDPV